ncbi:hypothetical protein F4861DRAFT_544389 [Xylaria intraflava]|nr:hypothetical protein F4861DRAFT_544389 [Xylaria intraflava]
MPKGKAAEKPAEKEKYDDTSMEEEETVSLKSNPSGKGDLIESLRIHLLDGYGRDRYVRWTLEDGFWTEAVARPSIMEASKDLNYRKPNILFVEASEGGPWGQYIVDLIKDARRTDAIFVQRYGGINAVSCECCIRRYTRADGAERRRGLWPFHECVSFEEVQQGACANCIWSMNGNACTYHEDSLVTNHFKANRQIRPIISDMTAITAPVVGPTLDTAWMIYITEKKLEGMPHGAHRDDQIKESKGREVDRWD